MEKRVVLSLVLSFLFLIAWQAIFPAPKPVGEKNMQVFENKEFATVSQSSDVEDLPEETEDIVSTENEAEILTIANDKIQAEISTYNGALVSTKILAYNAELPVSGVFDLVDFDGLIYTVVESDANHVVLSVQKGSLDIRKIYMVSDGEFLVNADVHISNTGSGSVAVSPDVQPFLVDTDLLGEGIEKSRDRSLLEYSVYQDDKVFRKTGAFHFSDKDHKREYGSPNWFGFRDRYYCLIVKPNFDVNGYEIIPKNKKNLKMVAFLNDQTLDPGKSLELSASIYVGPQQSRILESYGKGFEKIHVYFRLGFFDAIAKIIEDMIKFAHRFIPNWGLSIIFVSLLIYFSFYPLTMKSMLSMRKMQSLQPEIVELREKYEKNPQKLNQEIMKLYAENKVNPLGGCFPLLLQMPIFICLYQMIWRSVLFNGSGFLWIKDLSQPDRLIVLNKSFPIIGNEINVLPLIILVLMVIQQRMTAKNMNSTDPNQIAQQKMMMFMMPAVLFFVFYHIASGLSLYFTVFYIVSSFTQWRIGKKAQG